MKSPQQYKDQMNQLLVELVHVATELRDMSLKVISEEELAPLQKHQENLLAELEKVDKKIKAHYPLQVDNSLQDKVHHQLEVFQELNHEYVKNLKSAKGVAKFELKRLKADEEGGFSRWGLYKIPSSPNSSKTIKPQEDK